MSTILRNLRAAAIAQLESADQHYRWAQVLKTLPEYERVLKQDIVALFHDPQEAHGWRLSADDPVTLNRAVLLLSGYYYHTRKTPQWNRLVQLLRNHPDYHTLPLRDRVHIESIYTIRNMARGFQVAETVATYRAYLQADTLDDLSRGLAHHVLSQAYLVAREEEPALEHYRLAARYLTLDVHAVYHVDNQLHEATIYYLANAGRRHYFERAIELYKQAETLARELDQGHDFTYNLYNIGWIYAELNRLDEARAAFENGLAEAEATRAEFKTAQYLYGLGFVYAELGDHHQAIRYLTAGLYYFASESQLYSAACLNLMAMSLLAIGDFDGALERLSFARDNLMQSENPNQLHHVYRQFSLVYKRKGDLRNFLRYAYRTYQLKLRTGKPLLPY